MPTSPRRGSRPRIVSILSSRPEVIQAAPLQVALAGGVDEILVHTGQHYDAALSADQIADTRLPEPAYNLGVGSLPDGEQLALGTRRLAAVLERERPDAVLVRGDTNGTLSGARAAEAAGIPLVHVEAGLRSRRTDMPEERNRVETDRLSDLLLAPTAGAADNLQSEGVRGEVHVTGDVLCDMLLQTAPRLRPSGESTPYVLATIHRGYNTDDAVRLAGVMDCLAAVPLRVLLPAHPRLRERLREARLAPPGNVELLEPVAYTRMLALERDAQAVVTDSGGVQREAYLWGVPCVTLREETEWVETVESGWNTLVGVDPARVRDALALPRPSVRPPVYGDGSAAARIVSVLLAFLDEGDARA